MKVLFYDLETSGHHTEYIRHIVSYAAERQDLTFIIITNEGLESSALGLIEGSPKNVIFDLITMETYDQTFDTNLSIKRSKKESLVLKYYVEKHKPDYTILLHVNVFQFSLSALIKMNTRIRGILFHPFIRADYSGFYSKLNYFRKWMQLQWMLTSKELERIWLLNDPVGVSRFNHLYREDRFHNLNDPILPHFDSSSVDIYEKYSIPKDIHVFLFLGHISERKGIFNTLKAFRKAFSDHQNQAFLLICGKSEQSIVSSLSREVRLLKEEGLMLHHEERFVPDTEMVQLFKYSDTVLMPYLMSVGSSGILGHAAQVQKSVIGPNFGLLSEIIENYHLGDTIDSFSVDALSSALSSCVEKSGLTEQEVQGMKKYIDERKPEEFVKELLKEI